MSALASLKGILHYGEVSEETDGVEPPQSLENLVSYVDTVKKDPSITMPDTLELIRLDAINSSDDKKSSLHLLDEKALADLNQKFENFKKSIGHQKTRLGTVGSILYDFDEKLDTLSTSLTNLKNRSTSLTSDVSQQRTIIDKLNPIILDLMIPPEIVRSVISDPINPSWLENLRYINEKLQLLSNVKKNDIDPQLNYTYQDSKTFTELEKGINQMILKSVERIRDFIIQQIKLLRATGSQSSQRIQKRLLEVKDIFLFLESHHKELANELRLAYIYTMKWYYKTKFAKYLYAIEKLHIKNVDQSITLGASIGDERTSASLFGSKSWLYPASSTLNVPNSNSQPPLDITEYLLSIDKRIKILDSHEDTESERKMAIPSQIAETSPFSYWLEFIFDQWLIALMDNVVVEYLFVVDFFYHGVEKFDDVPPEGPQNYQAPKKSWPQVMFDAVHIMGNDFVTWLISHSASSYNRYNSLARAVSTVAIQGTCDAYAVLVMIRLVQNAQSLLHNSFHIPILDDYLNSTLLKLWPQFTKIIDLNSESMKRVSVLAPGEAKLAPATITQQFGQFLLGLLKLTYVTSKEGGYDYRGEPLFTSVSRLRNDFESVLTRLSNHIFGNGRKNVTEKEIFLHNNYFLLVSILKNENDVEGNGFVEEQIKHFEILCDAYRKDK